MQILGNNVVIFQNDEFFVSYLKERSEFAKLCDEIVEMADPNRKVQDRDETAIVDKRGDGPRYYILYGDHREQYKEIVPDLIKCIEYFMNHLEHIGYSSDMPEIKRS